MILAGATTRKTIAVLLVVVMLVATLGTGVAGAAAAPLAAPAAKAQFGGVACTYRVVAGDVLSRIALRYGTTSAYLAKINGIVNPNRIRTGQILVVPCKWTPQPHPKPWPGCVYLVKPGNTLSQIALRFGTTSSYLAAINNLANRNRIYAWSYLRVPCWDP